MECAAPAFAITRKDRENLLTQRGLVVWLYGLSGAGKSTLANEIAKVLHRSGRLTLHLDGDILRQGLNRGLGFTESDRMEICVVRRRWHDLQWKVVRLFCAAL